MEPPITPETSSENIYENERRDKAQKLRELGVDPFGGRVEGLSSLDAVRKMHEPTFGQDGGPEVKLAGRLIFIRDMGKLWFARLRDDSGELQVALDAKRLGERDLAVRKLLDLGDQIVVEGKLGQTKTGEVTVWATSLSVSSKSFLPPPSKEFVTKDGGERKGGFADVEARYRQRYVDLWANPEVMALAQKRIRIVDEIRSFLKARGFLEVETPMLQPMHGGAAARPFITQHNALDMRLYMRIAPELYLKRLLVGGFTKVFELNRNFRNEGISPRHNPEFTMLEAYEAYGSWETMAELVESMVCTVAMNVFGTLKIVHRKEEKNLTTEGTENAEAAAAERAGKVIDLEGDLSKPPGQRWRRVTMAELVEERTGWKFDRNRSFGKYRVDEVERLVNLYVTRIVSETWVLPTEEYPPGEREFVEYFRQHDIWRAQGKILGRLIELSSAELLVEFYEKLIEPTLINPTFVTQVPSVIIPLAKKIPEPGVDPKKWFFADVYELAINGQEISPGYSELNDPDVQREKLLDQVGDAEEKQKVDEDFLNALKYGMPPAGGLGLGIDRLVMMLTGAESIRDVILFPLMRPQS